MNYRSELTNFMNSQGFDLIRQRKHYVFRNGFGITFTTSKSPSDGRRTLENIKHQLNRITRRFEEKLSQKQ